VEDIIVIDTGWWFGTMEFYDFPIRLGIIIIPTDDSSIIFQRGRAFPHQPVGIDRVYKPTNITHLIG